MHKLLLTGLVGTILLHYVIFLAFFITCVVSIVIFPWYLALSLIALIVRVIFSSNECPLTKLENWFRIRLKRDKSIGFLEDYICRPHHTIRKLITKRKV